MEQTKQTMASAKGVGLGISPKYAFMICQHLRGRKTSEAKRILEAAIAQVEPIPFTKFNDGVGHRKGNLAAGRFPLKASKEILALIKSAEANAINKGMGSALKIKELRANKAASPMKPGRQRHEAKRAHVYVTLVEDTSKPKVKKAAKKTAAKSPAPKAETKAEPAKEAAPAKEEAKEEPKAEPKAEEKTQAKAEEKKE